MDYIKSSKPDSCIFCTKPAGGDDRTNQIVWRGELSFVMLNAYPYNNGHMMVAPYAHMANLEDLPLETLTEMMLLSQMAVRALGVDFRPEGMNLGINLGAVAGAGVKDHVHIHVVPRWLGDTNFMTVANDTRVIPQSLDHTWELLRRAFEALGD
jgi:ATP adenylyltransferase